MFKTYPKKLLIAFLTLYLIGFVRGQSIPTPPLNTTRAYGGIAVFQCQVKFGAFQEMTWDFNDQIIYSFLDGDEEYPLGNTKYFVARAGGDFNLTVHDLNYDDGGTYTCAAFAPTATAFLVVLGTPSLTFYPAEPKEDDLVIITCKAEFGGPKKDSISQKHFPQLQMFLDGVLLENTVPHSSDQQLNMTFNLTAAVSTKGAVVTCEIRTENPTMSQDSSSKVDVLYSVRNISFSPSPDGIGIGSILTCSADGNPQPSFEWTNVENPGQIIEDSRFTITDDMVGNNMWRCTGRNLVGEMFEEDVIAIFNIVAESSPVGTIVLVIIIIIIVLVLLGTGYKFRRNIHGFIQKKENSVKGSRSRRADCDPMESFPFNESGNEVESPRLINDNASPMKTTKPAAKTTEPEIMTINPDTMKTTPYAKIPKTETMTTKPETAITRISSNPLLPGYSLSSGKKYMTNEPESKTYKIRTPTTRDTLKSEDSVKLANGLIIRLKHLLEEQPDSTCTQQLEQIKQLEKRDQLPADFFQQFREIVTKMENQEYGQRDQKGRNILHDLAEAFPMLCQRGKKPENEAYLELIKLFSHEKSNVDNIDIQGCTVLHTLADKFSHIISEDCVEVFIEVMKHLTSCPGKDKQDNHNQTFLHILAKNYKTDMPVHCQKMLCKLLKNSEIELITDILDNNKCTATQILASKCYWQLPEYATETFLEALKYLAQYSNKEDQQGSIILHQAVTHYTKDMPLHCHKVFHDFVRIFLTIRNVDIQDNQKNTVLHLFVGKYPEEISPDSTKKFSEILNDIVKFANKDIQDLRGCTALHILVGKYDQNTPEHCKAIFHDLAKMIKPETNIDLQNKKRQSAFDILENTVECHPDLEQDLKPTLKLLATKKRLK